MTLLAGEHREGDREMCLSGRGVAEEDYSLAVIDPGALRHAMAAIVAWGILGSPQS